MSTDAQLILNAIARLQEEQAAFQAFVNKRFDAMEKRFDTVENRFDTLENRFDTLENETRKTNLIIENEIRPDIKCITEQLSRHAEILNLHTEQLERIEAKIETHDIQISVLDRTKSNKRRARS